MIDPRFDLNFADRKRADEGVAQRSERGHHLDDRITALSFDLHFAAEPLGRHLIKSEARRFNAPPTSFARLTVDENPREKSLEIVQRAAAFVELQRQVGADRSARS